METLKRDHWRNIGVKDVRRTYIRREVDRT